MPSDKMHLKTQRKRLDEIDQQLLDLLTERNTIIKEVTEKKIDHQLPVFAPERENEKVKAFRKNAVEQNIDAEWAEDFLRMVMASSRENQSSENFPRATPASKNILI